MNTIDAIEQQLSEITRIRELAKKHDEERRTLDDYQHATFIHGSIVELLQQTDHKEGNMLVRHLSETAALVNEIIEERDAKRKEVLPKEEARMEDGK